MARVASRLTRMYQSLKSEFSGKDCLVAICTGKIKDDDEDEIGYLKSYSFYTWLFGSELQNTAVYASKDFFWVITEGDQEKNVLMAALEQLTTVTQNNNDAFPKDIKFLDPEKDADSLSKSDAASHFLNKAIDVLQNSTQNGNIPELVWIEKEAKAHKGSFYTNFSQLCTSSSVNKSNASDFLSGIMAVKDEVEINNLNRAGVVTCAVFKNVLLRKLEDILDQELKFSHNKLSEQVERAILEPEKAKLKNIKPEQIDACYPPIIQSGGSYDLKPSAQCDDNPITPGCIIASLGARYEMYCANVGRTLLIDPTPAQEKNYKAVLAAQEACINALKPGVTLQQVYTTGLNSLKNATPPLDKLAVKNFGFGIGIEFRDGAMVISPKSTMVVKAGMSFNVAVGVQNLKDVKNGVYAILIADTVLVREKDATEVLTSGMKKAYKNISYNMSDEPEEEEAKKAPAVEKRKNNLVNDQADLGKRRTAAGTKIAETVEETELRKKHQQELAEKKKEEGRARLASKGKSNKKETNSTDLLNLAECSAYRNPDLYPTQLKPRQMYVDLDNECVLVSINEVPVPFHISMIKNATTIEEGSFTFLRINFYTPVASSGIGGRSKSKLSINNPVFPDEMCDFIKEVTVRSTSSANINDTVRKIKELKKRFTSRLIEKEEEETLVEQDELILSRDDRLPHLGDVSMRPPLATAKNNTGTLEAHKNGFRYRGARGSGVIDILYSNIKNAFFQEADKEVIVLVHFHLKNPIKIKNKTTTDVQFYTEVMEGMVRLGETRRRAYDKDELEEEQREREMRNRYNKLFLRFTKAVEDTTNIEFDIPYRSLGFYGAPRSSSVFLMPTVSCIIDLIDWPPFIVNLGDVEIAHFERMSFHLKNFDLVFVFKWFDKEPSKQSPPEWIRISAIPMKDSDALKKFLDEQQIKYYEGVANLNWPVTLRTIREDLEDFYERDGWDFLDLEKKLSDEEQDEEESMEDGDENFSLSEEDLDEDEDDDDYSDSDEESGSDDEAAARKELEGDSDEGEAELSSDEEGEDWDALERKARREDEQKTYGDDSDHERKQRKRKR